MPGAFQNDPLKIHLGAAVNVALSPATDPYLGSPFFDLRFFRVRLEPDPRKTSASPPPPEPTLLRGCTAKKLIESRQRSIIYIQSCNGTAQVKKTSVDFFIGWIRSGFFGLQ